MANKFRIGEHVLFFPGNRVEILEFKGYEGDWLKAFSKQYGGYLHYNRNFIFKLTDKNISNIVAGLVCDKLDGGK